MTTLRIILSTVALMTATDEEEVERKVNSLKVRRGVSVRTVLVYDGILEPRVEGTGFFDAIVRAGKLLG